jgi:hydroxymethylpyrimidine/phosphomethylpyrimidine kinase
MISDSESPRDRKAASTTGSASTTGIARADDVTRTGQMARALTIAGSDSSGGAGIQQDLRTFQALGVWGMSAITAVTVQDTLGVHGLHAIPPQIVAEQVATVTRDVGVDAAKTGMLPNAGIVEAVARAVTDHGIDALVVDPVMVSTSGDALTDEDAIAALQKLLLVHALIVTPNAREAERLSGLPVTTRAEQAEAGRALRALGARSALVTGGHVDVDGARAVDVFVDESGTYELEGSRIPTPNTHGTGCVLSAAITACLALRMTPLDAVRRAKQVVTVALEHSLALGGGVGPVDPSNFGRSFPGGRDPSGAGSG